ncbi:MAG: hypothetical protein LQ337_008305 [Flavoplaca oasis]|nr:MAG: hypothetical protein LQ337_008305 [Flavoplaca oasis]
MWSTVLGLPVLVSICSAKPTPEDLLQSGPSPSSSPSRGFPAEYLPLQIEEPFLSSTLTSTQNLTLPLDPQRHPTFLPLITYDYSDRPKGFELASSLATAIYDYWRDSANQQILGPITSRRLPYSQFLHTVQPTLYLGAALTPLKVGLAYCAVLSGVIQSTPASWPGHLSVRILDPRAGPQRKDLGTIRVDNSPAAHNDGVNANANPKPQQAENSPMDSIPSPPVPPANHNGRNQQLTLPIPLEKRWLTCYTMVLFFFTRHLATARFTDQPHLPPSPKPVQYFFPCGNNKDELTLRIFPSANKVLVWDTLVRSMLDWVNKAAGGPWGYMLSEEVVQGGVLMGSLTIKLGRGEVEGLERVEEA